MHGGDVSAEAHAKDFGVLQGVLAKAYGARTRPLVIGPDTTGCNHQLPTSSGNLQAMLAQKPQWNITTTHQYTCCKSTRNLPGACVLWL
jgi:hypothetical protein